MFQKLGEMTGAALVEELNRRRLSAKAKPDASLTSQEAAYECQHCRDEEIILVKKPYDEGGSYMVDLAVPCSCAAGKSLQRLFRSSQITPKMAKKTFDTFSIIDIEPAVRDAFNTAFEYLEHFEQIRKQTEANGLFLGGQSGSGKTHLCMAVVNALLERGVPVLYFPFIEGMQEVKHNFNANDEANREKMYKLQRVPVLYIDDLFKNKAGIEPTPHEIRFMFQLLNERYLQGLPTIFSCEYTLDQLFYWDAAVGSRIAEMTEQYQVLIIGDPATLNYRLPLE